MRSANPDATQTGQDIKANIRPGAQPASLVDGGDLKSEIDPIGENNVVASFKFAHGSIRNLTYCTVGSKISGGEHVVVFAQEVGVLTEDFKRVTVGTNMKRTRTTWWAEKGYAAQLELFLKGVRAGEPPQVTARDGARATVGLRMLESAKTLCPCTIDLEFVLR